MGESGQQTDRCCARDCRKENSTSHSSQPTANDIVIHNNTWTQNIVLRVEELGSQVRRSTLCTAVIRTVYNNSFALCEKGGGNPVMEFHWN